jgi:hypothetical protein
MPVDVIKNIRETISKLGEVSIGGHRLESAHPDLLDASKGGLDEHVSKQPALIAYYGALKKQASRQFDALKSVKERWEKKKYAEAKVAVESGVSNKSSIKVEDVKARLVVDNETEMVKRESDEIKAREDYDTLDVFYEALKQKSFSMRELASIEDDEWHTSPSIMRPSGEREKSPTEIKVDKMREIIRKRRLGSQ